MTAHAFSLYRSGWSGDQVPWPDNQLWAEAPHVVLPDTGETHVDLQPRFGHVASWYRLRLLPAESAEEGWTARKAFLDIDATNLSWVPLPLSWYVGAAADWPSGIARFPEPDGFHPATFPWPLPGARGVWTLAARRSA